jgi:hypothetical protein
LSKKNPLNIICGAIRIVHISNVSIHVQIKYVLECSPKKYTNIYWIGPNGKGFGLFKYVVGSSISKSHVCKKFGWKRKIHLIYSTNFLAKIVITNDNRNFIPIYLGNSKKQLYFIIDMKSNNLSLFYFFIKLIYVNLNIKHKLIILLFI